MVCHGDDKERKGTEKEWYYIRIVPNPDDVLM
jgi:hypothetical protein